MLTIIIPTLGERKQEFNRLLSSLETQTMPALELIIVSQNHHELVSEWLTPITISYRHIRLQEKGLSKARNAALPYVNGDLVTFSDDDCWYPNHAVATVHKYLKNDSDGCCFQIFDPEMNETYKNYPKNHLLLSMAECCFENPLSSFFLKPKPLPLYVFMSHSVLEAITQAVKRIYFYSNSQQEKSGLLIILKRLFIIKSQQDNRGFQRNNSLVRVLCLKPCTTHL